MGTNHDIDFLEEQFTSNDFEIRLEAAKSIANIGDTGIDKLKFMLISEIDEPLRNIINHALDFKIK